MSSKNTQIVFTHFLRPLASLSLFVCILSMAVTSPRPAQAEISQDELKSALSKLLETEDGKKMVAEATQDYFQAAEKQKAQRRQEALEKQMEEQFKNPVDVPVGDSPTKGPKDAPITIVEFSDFECPFCSRANETMKELEKKYGDKIQFVFKNLPLSFHQNAEPAAKAALAAGKQGKFWEMHDKLFENQKSLNEELYISSAKELGLNIDQFKKDMESEAIDQQIKDDMELAAKHSIRGTPGFFVNGVAVKGAYPASHFQQIIDKWLEKKA